jgi:hypothetical protein
VEEMGKEYSVPGFWGVEEMGKEYSVPGFR